MKETIRLNITKKVFIKADILRLAKELSVFMRESNEAVLKFQVSCNDNTSYESDSPDLFADGNIIDLKKTISINMDCYTYNRIDKNVHISLSQDSYSLYNNLVVSGDDPNWVNGTFTKLKDVIDAIKPQDNWLLRHQTLLLHMCAIGIGSLVFFLVETVFRFLIGPIGPIENPPQFMGKLKDILEKIVIPAYIFYCIALWLSGLMWAFDMRRWLLALWPDVEFDFGPEHLNKEKLRRKRISIAFSVIIIPTLINIVANIVWEI